MKNMDRSFDTEHMKNYGRFRAGLIAHSIWDWFNQVVSKSENIVVFSLKVHEPQTCVLSDPET